ncbi:MAG: hypothetical protein JWQ16_1385 [Novosphingobium sp.]|nr:hypothetical protein [Novosphingobium sp.]
MSEVEIELNGKAETLRCSLGAAKKVNNAGGFAQVLMKLSGFDMDYYVLVVSAGLGKKPSEVEEAVYKAGLPNLTEKLSEFVQLLANGGKAITITEDDKTGEA